MTEAMTPPTRYALVPQLATQAMSDALVDEALPIAEWSFQGDYERMLAASPNGGCVTAEILERAARILHGSDRPNQACREKAERIAREAFGLTVASEPTPAATEEGR